MEERHYAGVYWEDREVTKDECVTPILDTLARVGAHDALLSRWYVMRSTREETVSSWELTEADARGKLVEGIAPAVDDRPEFGWRVVVWNGEADQRSAKIELDLGGYMHSHVSPTPNSCVVRMPWPGAAGALLRRATMTALLGDLAVVWNADWGVVSTDRYLLGGPPPRPSHHPRVGWPTFLNGWRGRAPKDLGTQVTPVGTLGYVIGTEELPVHPRRRGGGRARHRDGGCPRARRALAASRRAARSGARREAGVSERDRHRRPRVRRGARRGLRGGRAGVTHPGAAR